MKKIILLSLLMATVISSGCSIKHPIAADYDQYLVNNESAADLPRTGLEANYSMDEKTRNHRYEFRSATAGYANLWIVEFGKVLEETLKSKYVQDAFGKLEEHTGEGAYEGNLISFSLESFEFKDYRAYISLKIILTSGGKEIINKTYHSEGKSQGGKMFWGGAFAMKNAIQQSTKLSLDEILSQFILDVNAELEAS